MNMTPTPEPDPTLVAAVSARATARRAHHEAGHAVAVIARGGTLLGVWLASTDDPSADTQGITRHDTAWEAQPFVTFAGPCAEAMWTVEHDDDFDDFYEALDYAWLNNGDGDTNMYEDRVSLFSAAAEMLGFATIRRAWEVDWVAELEPLLPAMREVAALLIDGQSVTHEQVLAAVNRCRSD
jgi:hypothetical protein